MITLITGTPGSGKTAYAVSLLMEMAGSRPIYADGVPELVIDHQPCPPVSEWTYEADDPASATGKKISFTFPANSIVVIDECQRVFRPRSSGSKVPPEVAAFETHRHLGIDFILITQHPSLVDGNIRRLVGKHIHLRVTALGRYKYEWAEIGDPDSRASREISNMTRYKLPKQAFSKYKSAELHTKHKFRIPKAVYVVVIGVVALASMGYYLYKSVSRRVAPDSPGVARVTSQDPFESSGQVRSGKIEYISREEYLAIREPRIEGLPHTAPVYDEVTKPQQAPEPVGCMISERTGCQCFTQQGTKYPTTDAICRQIFEGGMFVDWRPAERSAPAERGKPLETPGSSAEASPFVGSMSYEPPELSASPTLGQ